MQDGSINFYLTSDRLLSVDYVTREVRALEREADAYYGLEPGTNGTGAIMRRMGIGEPDYRWIRFNGRPAVGVTLIPTNTSDNLTSNPWSGKPCQERGARDEESEHVPDLEIGASDESEEELIAQVGDVLAARPYGAHKTKAMQRQTMARVRQLSNPSAPVIYL